MCKGVLLALYYVYHVHGDHEGQKRPSDYLQLEKQKVVSCYVNAGKLTLALWKSSKCS